MKNIRVRCHRLTMNFLASKPIRSLGPWLETVHVSVGINGVFVLNFHYTKYFRQLRLNYKHLSTTSFIDLEIHTLCVARYGPPHLLLCFTWEEGTIVFGTSWPPTNIGSQLLGREFFQMWITTNFWSCHIGIYTGHWQKHYFFVYKKLELILTDSFSV